MHITLFVPRICAMTVMAFMGAEWGGKWGCYGLVLVQVLESVWACPITGARKCKCNGQNPLVRPDNMSASRVSNEVSDMSGSG